MKKRPILLIVITLLLTFLCVSAGPSVPKELYIAPDPETPWTGTWYFMGGIKYAMHVIKGMDGTCYVKTSVYSGWKKFAVYTIEKKGDEYITSNGWPISVKENYLTVETVMYERVIK